MYRHSNNKVACSVDQNTCGEASLSLGTQVIRPHSMELGGLCRFQRIQSHVSVLSQMNPVRAITFYLTSILLLFLYAVLLFIN